MKELGAGLLATTLVTGLLWAIWGTVGIVPGVVFGGLATVIHVIATALLRSAFDGPFGRLMVRWAIGMGLRLVGVVAFAVAVFTMQDRFPGLPTAIAYVGVLLPLMGMEMNLLHRRMG